MRWFAFPIVLLAATSVLPAQHHDRRNRPVRQPIDLIGPLGNRLPPSYRRSYNRPTYLGGKIAYRIAPSSQEAMAWQAAYRSGAYRDHAPRLERHYFFRKPWEAIRIGARDANQAPSEDSDAVPTPAEELPRGRAPLSGAPQPSPVVVRQIERETIRERDGFGREFGAILLADPTTFRPDPDTFRPDPGKFRPDPGKFRPDPGKFRPDPGKFRPDNASATGNHPPPGPRFDRSATPRENPVVSGDVDTGGRSPDPQPASVGNTLQRLRAENEQLRRSLNAQTD